MRFDRALRILVATALGAALSLALAVPAGADPPTREPFLSAGATIPAGIGCADFAITITIDFEDSTIKTFFDKAGNPIRQTVTGRLILSVRNDTTLESVTYNLGGATHITLGADGTTTIVVTGNSLVVLFPTDVPPGPDTRKGSGRLVIRIDELFTLVSQTGRVEDVCATLAA